MSDLIDRKAAIDAVRKETIRTNPELFEGNKKFIQFMDDPEIDGFGNWQWANGFATALTAVKLNLNLVPPVHPEPKKATWWHYERTLLCTECHTSYEDDIMEYCGDEVPQYCPNCGAWMVKDE